MFELLVFSRVGTCIPLAGFNREAFASSLDSNSIQDLLILFRWGFWSAWRYVACKTAQTCNVRNVTGHENALMGVVAVHSNNGDFRATPVVDIAALSKNCRSCLLCPDPKQHAIAAVSMYECFGKDLVGRKSSSISVRAKGTTKGSNQAAATFAITHEFEKTEILCRGRHWKCGAIEGLQNGSSL